MFFLLKKKKKFLRDLMMNTSQPYLGFIGLFLAAPGDLFTGVGGTTE